jgi:putative CocE/NonD family hydrolase
MRACKPLVCHSLEKLMFSLHRTHICLSFILAFASLSPCARAQEEHPSKPPPADKSAQGQPENAPDADACKEAGLPAKLSGFSDKGEFSLYVNEDPIATIKFDLRADGSLEEEIVLSMAGQNVKTTLKLTPDEEGRPLSIAVESPLGPQSFKRDGSTLTFEFKTKKSTLTIKPESILFENFSPVLMSQAIRHYDRQKGGKQTFPILILNGPIVMDGLLELLETTERAVAGKDLKLSKYKYGLPGVDIFALADEQGKLYLAEVPAQRAAYIRSGYEALRGGEEVDPKLSKPEFEVVEDRGVKVPMRDGIELSADVYRPEADGKYPVIVVRTPYKKEMNELQGRFYARRGYVMLVQDCRGRFGSPGEWEPFINDPKDGYDTIEWAAAQAWSNGKVGMIGASYVGWVQWWAARENPPHLVTIIPNVAPPDPFYNIPYEYGVFFILGSIWWADVLESEATADLSGAAMSTIGEKKYGQLLRELPVIDLDEKVLGKKNKYWRKWIEHPTNDEYWEQANHLEYLDKTNIPVFHQSGWFDGDGIGSKLNYAAMRKHGHKHQKLVLGPWGHTPVAHRMVGDRDFGEAAIIDLPREYLRWFDHWLKGVDNGIDKEPLVNIFVMGDNKWLKADEYPLPQTQFEKWYLSSGGKANTSKGDGRLTREAPPADAPADKYTYDPGDPTPIRSSLKKPRRRRRRFAPLRKRRKSTNSITRR